MDFLTPRDVADMLNLADSSTVRYWLIKGQLKGQKLHNRQWLIHRDDLLEAVASGRLGNRSKHYQAQLETN